MNTRPIVRMLLAVAAVYVLISPQAARAAQPPLALTHATVIDATGGPVLKDQTVVVIGGRIQTIGRSSEVKIPGGATLVDATGKFVVPGLWDAHVHTRYQGIPFLSLFLVNGITSVRDTAGPWKHYEQIQKWQRDFADGTLAGPRIVSAGPLIDGPNSRWTHGLVVTSPEEGRRAVQDVREHGASFVKVYDLLARDTFLAIVDEAKKAGLPFAGHVPFSVSAAEASAAGQLTIEHLTGVLLASSSREDEFRSEIIAGRSVPETALLSSFDAGKAEALIAGFAKNHTVQVPTLSNAWTRIAALQKDPGITAGERLKYIPAPYVRQWETASRPESNAGTAEQVYGKYKEIVGRMRRSGVEFLAGTDTLKPYLVPGFSLQDELFLLVDAGLSPLEALQAATINPARVLGIKDLGTVEQGKLADLLLLDADPLLDIRNTAKIAAVVSAGRLFDRQALRRLAREAAEGAANWQGTPTGR
jgi:imidazolonepropionase-like amidohydrolase